MVVVVVVVGVIAGQSTCQSWRERMGGPGRSSSQRSQIALRQSIGGGEQGEQGGQREKKRKERKKEKKHSARKRGRSPPVPAGPARAQRRKGKGKGREDCCWPLRVPASELLRAFAARIPARILGHAIHI